MLYAYMPYIIHSLLNNEVEEGSRVLAVSRTMMIVRRRKRRREKMEKQKETVWGRTCFFRRFWLFYLTLNL